MTALKPLVDKLWEDILQFFFPINCVSCGKPKTWLCEDCFEKLEILEKSHCPVCTKPSIKGFTHPRCQTRYTPERLLTFYYYKGPVKELIKLLKYKKKASSIAPLLAGLVVWGIKEEGISLGKDSILIPVPMHWFKRFFEKPYNQTEFLAEELGKRLNLSVRADILRKEKYTESQTKLKRKERVGNVKGSFVVPKNKKKEIFKKDIVLVDDVFTTGATICACANALKRAGARYVYCLAMAKD